MAGDLAEVVAAEALEDVTLDLGEVVGDEQSQQQVVVGVDGDVKGHRVEEEHSRVEECGREGEGGEGPIHRGNNEQKMGRKERWATDDGPKTKAS